MFFLVLFKYFVPSMSLTSRDVQEWSEIKRAAFFWNPSLHLDTAMCRQLTDESKRWRATPRWWGVAMVRQQSWTDLCRQWWKISFVWWKASLGLHSGWLVGFLHATSLLSPNCFSFYISETLVLQKFTEVLPLWEGRQSNLWLHCQKLP